MMKKKKQIESELKKSMERMEVMEMVEMMTDLMKDHKGPGLGGGRSD